MEPPEPSSSQERWEYRVIHLNVAPPTDAPTPATAPADPQQPFSRQYLEQEFPSHYTHGSAEASGNRPQHPAQQLQDFLNGLGRQGWRFEGIHSIGSLLMMVFRRPLQEQPSGLAPQDTTQLASVLRRLEALEARQHPPAATQPAATLPAATVADGSVLDASLLQSHRDQPELTTAAAASALGFRSSASLANLGQRLGYPAGLLKRGINGKAAIYVGTPGDPGPGATRSRRRWIVVNQASVDAWPEAT